ncbi:hypothetical protein NQ318_001882 [Aromia moschata]|uniref:Protein FAM47E n=1 Tax=Aromia moschata TaxID=1265417 RepID=A0AAV8Z417_9CUCU|nr:hypothetical protein NQ318_001882 [Aromia moschata]
MTLKLFSAHRKELLQVQARLLASKAKPKEDCCPDATCNKKKRSIWNIFKKKKPPELPPIETCKKYLARKQWEPDPDLSEFGGTAYRTCGPAYIIQKDQVAKEEVCEEAEDRLLEKMERHPDLEDTRDPMPPFESVERRLIELSERKLHPFYKRYLCVPRRKTNLTSPKHAYKSRSGPITADEIPAHLKIDKQCLEQKNIFSEFKRVEPPRQLLAKMVEIRRNERPTYGGGKKRKEDAKCPQHRKPQKVDVTGVMK